MEVLVVTRQAGGGAQMALGLGRVTVERPALGAATFAPGSRRSLERLAPT